MYNIQSFIISSCAKKFATVWNGTNHLHLLDIYDYQKRVYKTLRIIPISLLFLIVLSSCNQAAAKGYLQPTPTLPSNQPSFSPISDKNVNRIEQIGEWEAYDVNAVAWSTDSSIFSIAGKESSDEVNFGIYTYRIDSSEKLWFSETYVPFSLAYSPDGHVIAVPSLGLSIFDAITGENINDVLYQKGTCFGSQAISYSPEGTKIFSLATIPKYRTTTIYIWDVKAENCLGILFEEQGVAFDFEMSSDGRSLALGLRDIGNNLEQQVHVWETETRKQTCNFKGAQPVALALDGNIIAAGNVDEQGSVELWEAKTCQQIDTLVRQTTKMPVSMDFSPDGKLLVVGDSDTFQIWDVVKRKLLFESGKLPNSVKILNFSPDGRFLLSETDRVSANDKAIINLWGVITP